MMRILLLVLAGACLAGTPEDEAWERKAIGMLIAHGDAIARLEGGALDQTADLALVRFLASYGGFKAQGRGLASRPPPRELDSLQAAAQRAELAFLVRMRNYQDALSRLSAGGPAMKGDSLLVKAMSSYVSMRMKQLTPGSELGAK